jgi:hypothetical protein
MRYKCHYCGAYLKPGSRYTLECECDNCSIGFSKDGEVDSFSLKLFEKGKDIYLMKDKRSTDVRYIINKAASWKELLQVTAKLSFSEDGIPQAYALWDKLRTYVIFS